MAELLTEIRRQADIALRELLGAAKLRPGDIFVLGASSSEILGEKIGTHSSMDAAQAVLDAIFPLLEEQGVCLAVQCCEHLNRCLIVEESTAIRYGLEIVNAVPHAHAGGAFATTAYERFAHPVAVEHIRARAGMDIGQTFIGMHLWEVAVPFRSTIRHIGQAVLSMCRTRPKFIGGDRAHYDANLK